MGSTQQVLFQVGSETYGIDIMHVKAIEKYLNVLPVPNAPAFIEGMINLRGEVIPVYSLRSKFGLPSIKPNEDTKLIIAKSNDTLVALTVDVVKEIIGISEENLNETPKIVQGENTAYIGQIAREKDQLVILLNLDGILSTKEKVKIDALLKEKVNEA